jgi:hypothetical protein
MDILIDTGLEAGPPAILAAAGRFYQTYKMFADNIDPQYKMKLSAYLTNQTLTTAQEIADQSEGQEAKIGGRQGKTLKPAQQRKLETINKELSWVEGKLPSILAMNPHLSRQEIAKQLCDQWNMESSEKESWCVKRASRRLAMVRKKHANI